MARRPEVRTDGQADCGLEQFFALSIDLFCIAGFDGYFKRLNPAWTETLGYAPRELLGKPFLDFVHPDDRVATRAEAARLARGGETLSFENRYRCRDGSYRWLLWKARGDAQRQLIYAAARDITRAKEAEAILREAHGKAEELVRRRTASLRRSRRKYKDVFDHSPIGICQTTREGRLLAANRTLAVMLGYEAAAELVQLNLPDDVYVDPHDRRQVVECLERSGTVSGVEVQWRRKDGATIWIQLDATAVRERGGGVRYYQAFVHDITTRKSLEEQLLQAQKMEAVGQLAGGVAHDFNNLLTAIVGHARLALNELPADSPPHLDVLEIERAADKAASLTRQLLAFSRRQVLQPRVLAPADLVREIEKMLRRLIGDQIELAVSIQPSLGNVRVDPGQLQQVLLNLALNARDAMPSGGRLDVDLRNVELDHTYARSHHGVRGGSFVLLSVSDTGVGMTRDVQARIFEPFFTTKPEGRGTGLGLSTVYGIVQQSGGHVWVYSEPGQGSTFKIYLPRTQEPVDGEAAPAPSRPAAGTGTETVLVVEDEQAVLDIVSRVLDERGYTVLPASTASGALEAAEAHAGPIHLLLSDMVMPEMRGPQLARSVSSLRPGIRVLFMSGYSEELARRNGKLGDDLAFIEKPFSPYALCEKVREVLGS